MHCDVISFWYDCKCQVGTYEAKSLRMPGKTKRQKSTAFQREWTYLPHQLLIVHYSVQTLSFYLKIWIQADNPFRYKPRDFFHVFLVTGVNY